MTVNIPTATAEYYEAYGHRCALFIAEIFDGLQSVRAVYEKEGTWHYIDAPDYYEATLTSKELTDAKFEEILEKINISMEKVFGKATKEPMQGTARIQWLLNNTVSVENNKLKYNK